MKKVLLTTVFSGYNYGSSLQAFASKTILQELDYDCELVAMKSLVRGRDIRLRKLFTIFVRSLFIHVKNGSKALNTYKGSYSKSLIGDSAARFNRFTDEYLKPSYLSWSELKKKSKESYACFAGSDQIWNSSTMYVDPLYYLRFAPRDKRIAFAPSLGRNFIADYNKQKMAKWISDFAHISVREDSAVKLVENLTGKYVTQLIDPTLILDGNSWKQILGLNDSRGNYILAYFLDNPSKKARKAITELREYLKCDIIAIPYQFDDMSYCDKVIPTGPIEFLELINNAKCVLTDSFHGTAFSINMHTPFFVFERSYGSAHSQNSRIESILKKVNMEDRFESSEFSANLSNVDFAFSEIVLAIERDKARDYLLNSMKL